MYQELIMILSDYKNNEGYPPITQELLDYKEKLNKKINEGYKFVEWFGRKEVKYAIVSNPNGYWSIYLIDVNDHHLPHLILEQ